MSLSLWPDPVPFDPGSGTASGDMKSQLDAASLPDALLLVSEPDGGEWAGPAALAVAGALCEAGRRVVLIDLDVTRASLHALVEAPNVEGIADVVLFGSSLERVRIRPAGEAFELVAAGAFAPDPTEVLDNAAWARLLAEARSEGVTVLGFASTAARGLDSLAERIPDVMVLGDTGRVAAILARLPESVVVRAVIRPHSETAAAEPVPEPEAPPAPDADAPPEPSATISLEAPTEAAHDSMADAASAAADRIDYDDGAGRAMIADLERRLGAPVAGATQQPPEATIPETLTPDVVRQPSKARSRAPLWIAIVVVVVLVGAVAILFGPRIAGRSQSPQGGAAGGTIGPARRADPLSWSVAIESREDLAAAFARADSLAVAAPGLQFYIAPILVDGVTFYRVLAGPMADSVSAAAIMQSLADRGLKIAASAWDVRSTPLAFILDEFDDRIDAEFRVGELRDMGVPSYIIEVPYTEGPVRHFVYAGAYSAPSEADAMRGLLRGNLLPDTLVVRVGRISS
ncbi:MAG: hypothetical protein L0271_06920 [Gemmatimonadetes bacterium]|nr:hypothetical protein [Gemmatimonadota bacterium]